MFTKQIAQLDELEGQVPPNLIQILRSMLGNCQQELTHRGEITLGWSPGDGSNGTQAGPANPTMNIGGGYTMNFQEGSIIQINKKAIVQGTRYFAKVVGGNFINGDGDGPRAVPVKRCDYDGLLEFGPVFQANTTLKANADTALFEDYVVEIAYTEFGTPIIVSDIWDDPIGTVKWESVDTANIRDGWRLCDGVDGAPNLKGRFIMSIDPDDSTIAVGEEHLNGTEDTIGDTGGERTVETATPFDNVDGGTDVTNLDNTDFERTECRVSNMPDEGDLDDTRPRYYVMAAIQRFE